LRGDGRGEEFDIGARIGAGLGVQGLSVMRRQRC
jgi:hypothetical protein